MSKHTPGPWDVTDVLIFPHPPAPGRIMSREAAEDLYNVAKEMQEAWAYFSEYDVPINLKTKLDAAIAKAEGGAL